MALEKKQISPKTKRIINIVVDVIVAVILAIALFLAVCTISSKAKGYDQYTEIFGKAYLAVQSNSMEGDKEDNFSRGDLIVIRTVDINDTRNFKVGDIITFKTSDIKDNGKMVLNTHRIKEIVGKEGEASAYITHGDNAPEDKEERVLVSEIVGVYEGKAGGIGHLFLFMGSSAGFFTCIVLPSLLVVVYFAVNLVLVIRREKKVQDAAAVQAQADEREKIRMELLAEMQAQNVKNDNQTDGSKPQPDSGDTEKENK